jgi:hypothetical protein
VSREPQTEDGQRILHNIKLLRQRFEAEAVAREASRSCQAGAEKGVYRARGDGAEREETVRHFRCLYHSDPLSGHFFADASEYFESLG